MRFEQLTSALETGFLERSFDVSGDLQETRSLAVVG